MSAYVTVDSLMGVNYETKKFEDQSFEETEKDSSREPRMFSLNQLRELFYLHLHRSDLKQTVEVT